MSKILVLCVDGVEEVECLTTVDFCRRAGIEVVTASVTGKKLIEGAHGINFNADTLFEDVNTAEFDGVVFPGGPGTGALGDAKGTRALAEQFLTSGKLLAAICAAPGMLSEGGILKGKTATGYPGCKPEGGANWTEDLAVRDGNLITGKGPGAATYFAFEIIGYLEGEDKKDEIYAATQMP